MLFTYLYFDIFDEFVIFFLFSKESACNTEKHTQLFIYFMLIQKISACQKM